MPDTPQRIATDTSQKVGIRYGETIKSYVAKYGDAKKLTAIPLARLQVGAVIFSVYRMTGKLSSVPLIRCLRSLQR